MSNIDLFRDSRNEPEYRQEPPLTEPVVVECAFVTGLAVHVSEHVVNMIGWTHVPPVDGEMEERRIAVRVAMPMDVARALRSALNKKFKNEH